MYTLIYLAASWGRQQKVGNKAISKIGASTNKQLAHFSPKMLKNWAKIRKKNIFFLSFLVILCYFITLSPIFWNKYPHWVWTHWFIWGQAGADLRAHSISTVWAIQKLLQGIDKVICQDYILEIICLHDTNNYLNY